MSRSLSSFRPSVEALESREVPARTRLLVDFNFDGGQRPVDASFTNRTFAQAFTTLNARGFAPRFLDFDGNGFVDTTTDVRQAAQAIINKLAEYYRPFLGQNVTILGIDVDQNTQAGQTEITRGLKSTSLQTFVIYLGGSEGNADVFGRAPQGAVGFNHEGFGQVYADSIVQRFLRVEPDASPTKFANFVASTIAHEMGHLLGVGHPVDTSQNRDCVMNSARDRGEDDFFVNRTYSTELFTATRVRTFVGILQIDRLGRKRQATGNQNPFQELSRSFRGQTDENFNNVRLNLGNLFPFNVFFDASLDHADGDGHGHHAHRGLRPPRHAVDHVFSQPIAFSETRVEL